MEPLSRNVPPPPGLRAAVLVAALARRRAGYPDPEALPPAVAPYAAEVDKLEALLREVYLARAFETWIHADDIRGALGRPPRPPQPWHLAPLADLHVRSLPAALAVSGRAHPGRTATVRLTGPGGATWHIPLAPLAPGPPAAEPDVTVTADVLDYCYAAANRRDTDTVPRTVEGDQALADDLFAVLATFSH